MKNSYKYKLDSSSKKYECPNCNKKTFVLYIDTDTNEKIHKTVGKCDRADKCNFHYTPKQFFADNGINNKNTYNVPKIVQSTTKQVLISYIAPDTLKNSLNCYENNNLIKYLHKTLNNNDEAVKNVIKKYFVGSKNNDTIFWQVDTLGQVRTGKIMKYDCNGKRQKNTVNSILWVHNKIENFNLSQCFFGEHLLNAEANKTVCIVESEKTALIASVLIPKYVWLACGGSDGLNTDKCKILIGRKIVLFPDCNMFDKWNKKAVELRNTHGIEIYVSDMLEKHTNENQHFEGYDLADCLLDYVNQSKPTNEVLREFTGIYGKPKPFYEKQPENENYNNTFSGLVSVLFDKEFDLINNKLDVKLTTYIPPISLNNGLRKICYLPNGIKILWNCTKEQAQSGIEFNHKIHTDYILV